MTDLQTPPQNPETTVPSSSRGLKIALVISVALNLAVAGLVVGAWLGDGPRKGLPRDLSFGPFSEALSQADRRALRAALFERFGEFREAREASRAEFDTLLVALRADPLDPAALSAALSAIETRITQRMELGRTLIEQRIVEMSAEDRQAFADRLEQGLRRNPKKD